MFKFNVLFLVIFALIPRDGLSKISDKRSCANQDCTERISLAKTVIRYNSPEKGILSVPQNAEVAVYSKSAGSNMDLWGVEFKGKRGYLNKNFLRETRVFKKVLPFIVNTELDEIEKVPSSNISPNQQIEIVDGTTITLSPNDIDPSATEENVKPTESVLNSVLEGLSFGLLKADNEIEKNKEPEDNDINKNENDEVENEDDDEEDDDEDEDENEEENEDVEEVNHSKDKFDVNTHNKEEENEHIIEEINHTKGESQQIIGEIEQPIKESGHIKEENVIAQNVKTENIKEASQVNENVEKQTEYKNEINSENIGTEQTIGEEIVKESITTRNLLQVDDSIEPPNYLKKQTRKLSDIPQMETAKDENSDKPIEFTPDIKHENMVVTESSLDDPFGDIASVDSVTENPGKLVENKIESVENKDDITSIKNDITKNKNEDQHKTEEVKNVEEKSGMEEKSSMEEKTDIEEQQNVNVKNDLEGINIGTGKNEIVDENIVEKKLEENLKENENIKEEITKKEEEIPKEKENISKGKEEISKEQQILNEKEEIPKSDILDNNESLWSFGQIEPKQDAVETITKEEKVEPANEIDNLVNNVNNLNLNEPQTEPQPIDTKIPAFDHLENETGQNFIPNDIVSSDDSDTRKPLPNDGNLDNINSENTIYNNDMNETLTENTDFSNLNPSNEATIQPNTELPEEQLNPAIQDVPIESKTESDSWYGSLFGGSTENVGVKENNVDENSIKENLVEENAVNSVKENGGINTNEIKESVSEINDSGNENILPIQDNIQPIQDNIQNFPGDYIKPNFPEENDINVKEEEHQHNVWTNPSHSDEGLSDVSSVQDSCSAEGDDCSNLLNTIQNQLDMDLSSINFSDVLNLVTVLGITGLTVVIFLLGYIAIDKSRRETPLVAKINKLEKALLVSTKENQILAEKVAESATEEDISVSKVYAELEECNRQLLEAKAILEEQVQSLEKELENSTEVGFELNRMLSEILKSQSGSDMLVANIEGLQRQLVEQQTTINTINETLNLKDTENHELQLELEIKSKKVVDLQSELDKMALNLLKVEEEKDQIQMKLELEIQTVKEELEKIKSSHVSDKNKLTEEINSFKKHCSELKKAIDLKSSEYNILKDNFNQIKTIKNNQNVITDLLQSVASKAELIEIQKENKSLGELLAEEKQLKLILEQRTQEMINEMTTLKEKYDEADREKLEAQTKLEVLGNYFKEREAELQRELAKQEALWQEKQGEATSSSERMRYIKDELQNYKSQNELLKQEIVAQEVELKSQISVLEKKAHESWLSARQAERRLEDAKQEAAQLRNRLTLKERNFIDDKGQHRVQSPLDQNGDVTSPLHMSVESPASPPLIYSTHDHLTTSPSLPGLPPFLPPPPPGVPPFMPPPIPGVPGFMPPPPSMFPVDHRPPPLGRMSSPPLNSRYSPDSSRYSDRYDDRNSPSPPHPHAYDDDDRYGPSSPPPRHPRPYSPYRNERREYKRPNTGGGRTNGRNKGVSSGSENSNSETIDRINRPYPKI